MSISRRALGAGGAALLLRPFVSPASAQAPLEWVAGALGGGWYTMTTGCAQIVQEANPDIIIRVVPGGGVANPTRVNNGVSQLGMGLDFLVSDAYKGRDPYREPHTRLAHAGVGWSPTEHHMLRRVDGGPTDMKAILTMPGLRIGCPQTSSSDTLVLAKILNEYGTSFEKIRAGGGRVVHGSYNDLTAAFGDNQVDYVYVALAKPAAMVMEIARGRRQAHLVAFPQDLRDALSAKHGLSQGVIPAGTYPGMQDGDVPVTTMDTVLCVSTVVPEETVYRIVKSLIAAKARLGTIHPSMAAFDPAKACKYPGAPLHPGARRAYAEAGCTA
ncbi:MAG: TAXI family TRAP transporter solute-binding subunit [Acetobacteraceae bacterium]|nr:TAXI family TRAP transporter solute-binding subunit [Acetobacteraceae bacterium]